MNTTIYQMLLVKPFQKEGEKKYSYTNIGIAFKKDNSDLIDMKLDLFPVLVPGAFIRLKPIKTSKNEEAVQEENEKKTKKKK